MRIRTATQDDLDAICRVEAICFPASEAATRESLAARLKVFSRHFLLLEDEGTLIGFVNGMVTDARTISDVMFEQAELTRKTENGKACSGWTYCLNTGAKGMPGSSCESLSNTHAKTGVVAAS